MDHLRALRTLGIPPGSTGEEIRTAWRDLAKVWHPDRFAEDPRLQQKAGDNLSRINQAYEALRDYDPAVTPKIAARVRESVAMVFGIGELGEPRGPIGLRRSLRILGLGTRRSSASAPRQKTRSPLVALMLIILALAALALAYWAT